MLSAIVSFPLFFALSSAYQNTKDVRSFNVNGIDNETVDAQKWSDYFSGREYIQTNEAYEPISIKNQSLPVLNSAKRVSSACRSEDERIGLFMNIQGFHGSTAMLQALISTHSVATACRINKWECEEVHTDLPGGGHVAGKYPVPDKLSALARYYDLNLDILLLQKFGAPQTLFEENFERTARIDVLQYLHNKMPLPDAYTAKGIQSIRPVVGIMWRPYCLQDMSKHKLTPVQHLSNINMWIKIHEEAISHDIQTIVVNFGDLVWNQRKVAKTLSSIPCMNEPDFDYEPVLGVDVFKGNKLKTKGSLAEFGHVVKAESFGYDVEAQSCPGGLANVPKHYAKLIEKAESKLRSISV